MFRGLSGLVGIGLLCASFSGGWGCTAFQSQRAGRPYAAVLDDSRTVELCDYVQANCALKGPKHNYAALSLCVADPDRRVCSGGEVARLGWESSSNVAGFQFGKLAARTDAGRQRVWIVDTDARRVIASLDCTTGDRTGPCDEAPPWATLEGGTPLVESQKE